MKSLMKGVKKRLGANEQWEGQPATGSITAGGTTAGNANSNMNTSNNNSITISTSHTGAGHPTVSTSTSSSSLSSGSSSSPTLSPQPPPSSPLPDLSHLPRCRMARAVPREVIQHNLPALRDAAPASRRPLLLKKLRLSCYCFNFDETQPDSPNTSKDKETKRQTLLELVNYLTVFKPSFTEDEVSSIFDMLSVNLFRPLPPSMYELSGVFSPEEDDPVKEPSWPHLQVIYEFLLRLATSTETDSKLMDKYFNRKFILCLLELFDSEDPRERDYLKTILHRIYGNFMSLRPFIRRAINNVFYRFIYETDRHNGIAELLEILGSIINGFALPLKEQHKQFLIRVLLPLHKVTHVAIFHPQLSYCVTQFLEKDQTLAPSIILSILKFWPLTSSKKELMFLNELEEILDRIQSHHLLSSEVPLFTQIAKSINSPHFQVAERAIYILNNDVIVRFIAQQKTKLIPLLATALIGNIQIGAEEALTNGANTNNNNNNFEMAVMSGDENSPSSPDTTNNHSMNNNLAPTSPPIVNNNSKNEHVNSLVTEVMNRLRDAEEVKSHAAALKQLQKTDPILYASLQLPLNGTNNEIEIEEFNDVEMENSNSTENKSSIHPSSVFTPSPYPLSPALLSPHSLHLGHGARMTPGHWNQTIVELTADIIKLLSDVDPEAVKKVVEDRALLVEERVKRGQERIERWNKLKQIANKFIAQKMKERNSSISKQQSSSSSSSGTTGTNNPATTVTVTRNKENSPPISSSSITIQRDVDVSMSPEHNAASASII